MGVVTEDNSCQIGPCGSVAHFLPFSHVIFALCNFPWTSTEDSALLVLLI